MIRPLCFRSFVLKFCPVGKGYGIYHSHSQGLGLGIIVSNCRQAARGGHPPDVASSLGETARRGRYGRGLPLCQRHGALRGARTNQIGRGHVRQFAKGHFQSMGIGESNIFRAESSDFPGPPSCFYSRVCPGFLGTFFGQCRIMIECLIRVRPGIEGIRGLLMEPAS